MHQAHNSGGNARLVADLHDALRREWRALGWLQDEGVPTGDCEWQHPHRHHEGEVEWGDAGNDADREAHHLGVDAARNLVKVLAHQQGRSAAGKVNDFDATANLTCCVAQYLAVLGGDEFGKRLAVVEHRLTQLEEVAGALWWRHLSPLNGCGTRRVNGSLYVGGVGERNIGKRGLGCRVWHDQPLAR